MDSAIYPGTTVSGNLRYLGNWLIFFIIGDKSVKVTTDFWTDLAHDACNHAGIRSLALEPIATWDQLYCANAVYRIQSDRSGDWQILKIYGPTARRQFLIERSVLRTLEDQAAISAPRILYEGEIDGGLPYLVMTEVAGATAEDIWDELSRSDQLALSREFGAMAAAIHRLPQDDLAAVEQQAGGKEVHINAYRAEWEAEIERTEALTSRQRDELLRFLLEEAPQHLDGPPVLAHFDMAHNHIYMTQDSSGWGVAGIIDWAEAVIGPPEWDITYLWFWTFTRDREAMRDCLAAYFDGRDRPAGFARRCMAAVFHTSSMRLLWPHFVERYGGSSAGAGEMTAFFFPPELFGPPHP
jgi:hygromycin-B 7''-O-kinase